MNNVVNIPKQCIRCKEVKTILDFYPKKNICKKCLDDRRREKKDLYNERRRERRMKDKKPDLERAKKYLQWKLDNPNLYQKRIERINEFRVKNWHIEVLSRLKRRALEKNVPFNLTKEDLFIPKLCPILEIPLEMGGRIRDNLVSWDRIIPSLGYIRGNVRAISYRANVMKNDQTEEKLKIFCKNILKYIKNEI